MIAPELPDSLMSDPPVYGPRVREFQKTLEIRDPRPRGGSGGSVLSGAFYGLFVNSAGDTYLQGGQVKCGETTLTDTGLPAFKVIDHATGPEYADGYVLFIHLSVDGYVEDGVLLGGLTATLQEYGTPALAVPDDTLPTVAHRTGRDFYTEIGRWTDTGFLPSNIGNIRVSFCGTGSYGVVRY